MGDYIDAMRQDWATIRPELSTEPAEIVGRIVRLARIIQVQTDEILAAHGISRDEFDLLSLLIRSGAPLTPSDLAKALWVSASGTTKRLNKLEAAGLITRAAHPDDARASLVTPTATAVTAIGPALQALGSFDESLLTAVPAASRQSLEDSLRTMLIELDGERPRA